MAGKNYTFVPGARYEITYSDGRQKRFTFVGGLEPQALMENGNVELLDGLLRSRVEFTIKEV